MTELRKGNIFADIPGKLQEEVLETLLEGQGELRMERILSSGHVSPEGFWYDQQKDEYVILLSGRASLSFREEGEIHLTSGDWLLIPAHKEHRITYTSTDPLCVWLALHFDLKAGE